MNFFPIFLSLENQRVIVSGGGEAAIAKLRLLFKTSARIEVFTENAEKIIKDWAREKKLTLYNRPISEKDLNDVRLFYAANDNFGLDEYVIALAKSHGVFVNAVDNLKNCDFITPAIVDRDPTVIAIGTEGAAPVVARQLKAQIEASVPHSLGKLTKIGKSMRNAVSKVPYGRFRRMFWDEFYFKLGPRVFAQKGEFGARAALDKLIESYTNKREKIGHVYFVGAGPGDPELLTLKARNIIHEGDVILYDKLISPDILELARREAVFIDVGKIGYGRSTKQDEINSKLVSFAKNGLNVVRLKGGDPAIFGRLNEEVNSLLSEKIEYTVVPGITAASAAVAATGQSLSQRHRNKEITFISGHDSNGFAEHNWEHLANPKNITAIYMGKKSARFIQGRLLMHGAQGETPVTIIENATYSNQKIVEAKLWNLASTIQSMDFSGPTIIFLGLSAQKDTVEYSPANLLDVEEL